MIPIFFLFSLCACLMMMQVACTASGVSLFGWGLAGWFWVGRVLDMARWIPR
jgi:hypothetical protein